MKIPQNEDSAGLAGGDQPSRLLSKA